MKFVAKSDCFPVRGSETGLCSANTLCFYNIRNEFLFIIYITFGGTRSRSWLRHCASSQKVAVSIPDDGIKIFHLHNPSGRTMALGLTQPLTEMSTRYISLG